MAASMAQWGIRSESGYRVIDYRRRLAIRGLLSRGFLDGSVGLTGVDAQFDGGSFIVLFFAFAYSDLDFDEPLLEVHAQWHNRDTLTTDLPHESIDLGTFQEQLPCPGRL